MGTHFGGTPQRRARVSIAHEAMHVLTCRPDFTSWRFVANVYLCDSFRIRACIRYLDILINRGFNHFLSSTVENISVFKIINIKNNILIKENSYMSSLYKLAAQK